MLKYYIGYHNKPWDMDDFTIIAETANKPALDFIFSTYKKYDEANDIYVFYESRQLPLNSHY